MKGDIREGGTKDFQGAVLSSDLGLEDFETQSGAQLGACTSFLSPQSARPLSLSGFYLFIPGQLPALHSIFPLCFHGNVIAPGVLGPERGRGGKGQG